MRYVWLPLVVDSRLQDHLDHCALDGWVLVAMGPNPTPDGQPPFSWWLTWQVPA